MEGKKDKKQTNQEKRRKKKKEIKQTIPTKINPHKNKKGKIKNVILKWRKIKS